MKPAIHRKAITRALLDKCPTPTTAPAGMPRWWGERLWYGTQTEHEEVITEYLLHDRKEGRKPILRLRASQHVDPDKNDGLLGIYGPGLSRSGSALPVPSSHEAMAARLEEAIERGFAWAPGVIVKGVQAALDALTTHTDRLSYTVAGKHKRRIRRTPPLYKVAWSGFLYASSLVWDFDHDAPAAYLFERVGRETQRLSLDRELANLGPKTAGVRLPWWEALPEAAARDLAHHLMTEARRVVEHPPDWDWWAGTAARCDGFVERSWTGSRCAVSVRSGDAKKRTAVRTVVRRFVRPSAEVAPEEQLALGL